MSDNFRESFTDKAEAKLKVRYSPLVHVEIVADPVFQPDSEKSTTEHFGDKLKGHADSAASTAQPAVGRSIDAATFIP